MVTLYKLRSSGKMGTWQIYATDNIIYMHTQLLPSGKVATKTEVVTHPKSTRSLAEQVQSRIDSRVKNKLDSGFKRTEQEARDYPGTNTLNLPIPMLASTNTTKLGDNVFVQPKLDGMRLMVTRQQGELIGYTREGIRLVNIEHILDDVDYIIEEGEIIDGELYEHGRPLNEILSLVKRKQAESTDIKFYMFDMVDDKPFAARYGTILNRMQDFEESEYLHTVRTDPLMPTGKTVPELLQLYRQHGFEGLILRDGDMPYEIDTRSTSLVKVKHFLDAEYPVLEVTVGAQGMPVLVCQADKGRTFRVTAPGTHTEKQWALKNPEFFIGNMVTIKYAGLTSYGIPFHPVCLGRRM